MVDARIDFNEIDEIYNLILRRNENSHTTAYQLNEELYDKLVILFNENKPDFSKEYKRK